MKYTDHPHIMTKKLSEVRILKIALIENGLIGYGSLIGADLIREYKNIPEKYYFREVPAISPESPVDNMSQALPTTPRSFTNSPSNQDDFPSNHSYTESLHLYNGT